jgi:hypothetical protein
VLGIKNLEYKKHIYWLTKDEEMRLRADLAHDNVRMKSAKGVVCTPLDEVNKISSVAPEVWNDGCKRQGSWYRHSDKNGLYVVVSSFEIKGYTEKKAATITKSDFVPHRLASQKDKESLIKDDVFKRCMPSDWKRVEEKEKRIYLRWANRLGSDVKDYNDLFLSHTANHANFMRPRFFVQRDEGIIPYSIDYSSHLCSSCLELFQIIGSEFKRKLVAPCPGATFFARLEPDRYLWVEST